MPNTERRLDKIVWNSYHATTTLAPLTVFNSSLENLTFYWERTYVHVAFVVFAHALFILWASKREKGRGYLSTAQTFCLYSTFRSVRGCEHTSARTMQEFVILHARKCYVRKPISKQTSRALQSLGLAQSETLEHSGATSCKSCNWKFSHQDKEQDSTPMSPSPVPGPARSKISRHNRAMVPCTILSCSLSPHHTWLNMRSTATNRWTCHRLHVAMEI